MRVHVGVLLNSEYPARELVHLGWLSEELGYDQLWYTDIRLFRECFLGLGSLAHATSRILLGPGVTDPTSRHPAVTASTMATLDEISDGRAILGLDVGARRPERAGDGRPSDGLIPDSVVAATVAAGHPERVAGHLAAATRPGMNRITIGAHEIPGTGVAAVLQAFTGDVMPLVQKQITQRTLGLLPASLLPSGAGGAPAEETAC